MSTIPRQINSFNAGELSPDMLGRSDVDKYYAGCRTMINAMVMMQGGFTRRPGTTYMGEAKYSHMYTRIIPFSFSTAPNQSYILEFGDLYMRVYTTAGQVLDGGGSIYEIVSPYKARHIRDLQFKQSADTLYIVHPEYAPRKLIRAGHTSWSFSTVTFGPNIAAPTGLGVALSGAGSGTTHEYVVTAWDMDILEESVACTAANDDGPATLTSSAYMQLTWNAVTGATEYWVYKLHNGIYGFIGKVGTNSFNDYGEYTEDTDITPPTEYTPFDGDGNYPVAMEFYQQRGVFGGSYNYPANLWFTRSGNFENLNRSTPLRDDDAITRTLMSDSEIIKWIKFGKVLMVGTAVGEWFIGGSNGAVTYHNILSDKDTGLGSADRPPAVRTGNAVCFLERGGRRVRQIKYNLAYDSYMADDLSLLANHLSDPSDPDKGGIVEWAYQQNPQPFLWCIREDGTLLGFTQQELHKVEAWHRHITDGKFESVAVIPANDTDEAWFVVRREIDGRVVRTIEKMARPFADQDIIDALFMDCALSYNGNELPGSAVDDDMSSASGWSETSSSGYSIQEYVEGSECLLFSVQSAGSGNYVKRSRSYGDILVGNSASTIDLTMLVEEIGVASSGNGVFIDIDLTSDVGISICRDNTGIYTYDGSAYNFVSGMSITHEWEKLRFEVTNIGTSAKCSIYNGKELLGSGISCYESAGAFTSGDVSIQLLGETEPGLAFVGHLSVEDAEYHMYTSGLSGLDHLEGCSVAIVGDGAVIQTGFDEYDMTVTNGSLTMPRKKCCIHVGIPYYTMVEPMPLPHVSGALGITQVIADVTFLLARSMGFKYGPNVNELQYLPLRDNTDPTGSPPAPRSGAHSGSVDSGYGDETTLVIYQDQPVPLTVTAIMLKISSDDT